MTIRKSIKTDLARIAEIYEYARAYMRQTGNPDQWKDNHPPLEAIEADIRNGVSYVCIDGDKILAVFFFTTVPDPTYTVIDGEWLNDEPYGVIHRIARAEGAGGVGAFCMNWCYEQIPNLRIDTHQDNAPMIKVLENLGFVRCGIIWLENGEERVAFQKCSR